MLCPGWENMSEGIDPPPREEATEGTTKHAVTHKHLTSKMFSGNPLILKCATFHKQQTEGADKIMHEIVLQVKNSRGGPMFQYSDDEPPSRADVVAIWHKEKKVKIIDWKFVYKPPNNDMLLPQMAAYAVGVWDTFQDTRDFTITVSAYCPRLELTYNFEFWDVDLARAQVEEILTEKELRPWHLNPSPGACENCPGLTACPAAQRGILDISETASAEVLAVGKLEELKMAKPVIDQLYKKINHALFNIVEGGGELSHFDVQEVKNAREIPHIPSFHHAIRLYLSEHQAMECCTMSVGDALDRAKRNYKATVKSCKTLKDAEEAIKKLAGDTIHQEGTYKKLKRKP